MRSPYCFIVRPYNNRRYDNIKKYGNKTFYTSVSEEDHTVATRFAKVVNTPINYEGPVQIGDTLVVHHNTFKFYNDMRGRQKSGRSWLIDDLFLVEPDQFFLYKQKDEWETYDKYCFVKPVPKKKRSIQDIDLKYEPLHGELVYPNIHLKNMGLKKGDEVCFQPDSEYAFNIDGEILYRMFSQNITLKNDIHI
tara:strand:+ start:307 stop:885 length:579 start_codon:yes stop_codon:yes gene_type:complete